MPVALHQQYLAQCCTELCSIAQKGGNWLIASLHGMCTLSNTVANAKLR